MKKKTFFFIGIGIFLLLGGILMVNSQISSQDLSPINQEGKESFVSDFEIIDDSVVLDNNKATLNITPHTLDSSGWVEFDLTTKTFGGDVDIAFGFNDNANPSRAEVFDPHNVTETLSSTCDERLPGYTNGVNTTLKRAWCFFTYLDEDTLQNVTLLAFNRTYDTLNSSSRTIFWNETHLEDWIPISNQKAQKVEKDFGNLSKWFLFKNKTLQPDTNYRLRYYLSIPYNGDGKYGIAMKRTQDTLEEAQANGNIVFLDPWYSGSYTDDFHVQRGTANIATSTSKVTITAGTDYDVPFNDSHTFIRLTNTRLTGGGHNSGGNTQGGSAFMVVIANPENISEGITFARGSSDATFNTEISWEIIEFTNGSGTLDNQFIVRRAEEFTFAGGVTEFNGTATTNIGTDEKVIVVITGQQINNTEASLTIRGMFTSEWDAAHNLATFTKGAAGNFGMLSYAILEFTGSNWGNVERLEHNFGTAGTEEFEVFSAPFTNISNVFSHTQGRRAAGNLDDIGSQVRVVNTTTAGFILQSGGDTTGFDVIWAIENNGTNEKSMFVQRAYASRASGGSEPDKWLESFTPTDNINTTGIWGISARSAGTGAATPRGTVNINATNTTTAALWHSDSGQPINYAFEFVKFPTASSAVDTTKPTFEKNQTNNTVISVVTNFALFVNDDTALHPNGQYIFSTNNSGGTWTNDSAVNFTSTGQWANVTKVLNSTVGTTVGYAWYIEDNVQNTNHTITHHGEPFKVVTTATDSCSYTSGNWVVDCSDNCEITSNVAGDGSNVTISGTGHFTMNNANVSGFNFYTAIGTDATNICIVTGINNGGFR